MRTFTLHRSADPSGVSGLGVVAEGCEYTDGSVALRWLGDHPATAVWPSLDEVLAVHGHDGATLVVFHDPIVAAPVDGAIPDVMRKLADLIGQGLPYLSANFEKYGRPTIAGLHVRADEWPAWVNALGGSTDDPIVSEPHGAIHTQHRWMSPDAKVSCFCLTANEVSV